MKRGLPILLVEDDVSLRDGMQEYLTLSGFAVTVAGTGVDCLNLLAHERFAVAVIDLGLPDLSGHQLVEYLRRCSDTAVIVLTASNTLNTRVQSYQHGADLFMNKPVDARELVAAITSLATRRKTILVQPAAAPAPVAEAGVWHAQRAQWTLFSPAGVAIRFTAKEFEFIERLVDEAGGSVSRAQLCQALYKRYDDTAQAALSTLVKRVRQRLSEAGINEGPILTDHRVGYRFAAPIQSS